jgi:hypothetical protein
MAKGGGKNPPLKAPAPVPQTGQTTSYALGDDGDLQKGVPWPEPRFTDNGDGTVTDNLTGLMWTKDINQIPGTGLSLSDAIGACNELVLANYDDWRMPKVREFFSLVAFTTAFLPAGHPFLNESNADNFWTSTPPLKPQGEAFLWGFGKDVNGMHTIIFDREYSRGQVWCVRGGK